jgi:uncharacterized protein YktA (UPF0223 family)
MKELNTFRQYLTEGVIKEEQMGSYKKFLKVVKSYEDEEILSDFLDSYPKGQDISKSEYERFSEKHLGPADPEDYRGENWKYIMSESVVKENDKNDYANSEEDYTDGMVIEKIKDIIKYHELDPSDVLEEIGQEFGIAFEFGRG